LNVYLESRRIDVIVNIIFIIVLLKKPEVLCRPYMKFPTDNVMKVSIW